MKVFSRSVLRSLLRSKEYTPSAVHLIISVRIFFVALVTNFGAVLLFNRVRESQQKAEEELGSGGSARGGGAVRGGGRDFGRAQIDQQAAMEAGAGCRGPATCKGRWEVRLGAKGLGWEEAAS